MPTSAPGSSVAVAARGVRGRHPHGFTLIEVLVVVAIVAVAMGLVSLAIRDPAASQLEREAARLVALLESARAEARSMSKDVRWVPAKEGITTPFRFVGLAGENSMPTKWLDERVTAQVVGSNNVVLGPEPILPPQRIVLSLGDQRLEVASDGLSAFAVAAPESPRP